MRISYGMDNFQGQNSCKMDKYQGLRRAQIHTTPVEYRVVKRQKTQPAAKNNLLFRADFLIRWVACLLVVMVCAVGKFTSIGVAQQASALIKNELQRDSLQQLYELTNELFDE